MEALAIGQTQH